MFNRLKKKLYKHMEEDPTFNVKYDGKKVKLILSDHHLKIGEEIISYNDIPSFGYDDRIFYIKIKNKWGISIKSMSYKRPDKINHIIYQKCLDLVEVENPVIDISSIPDPLSYNLP